MSIFSTVAPRIRVMQALAVLDRKALRYTTNHRYYYFYYFYYLYY